MPAEAVERGVRYDGAAVSDDETLQVGGLSLEAVDAPGRATGTTAFAVGDGLLTGDSPLTDGVARPDLGREADAPAFELELGPNNCAAASAFADD